MSYTYVILPVSQDAYEEIREKLLHAGYQHALHDVGVFEKLDMHGIALQVETKYSKGSANATPADTA